MQADFCLKRFIEAVQSHTQMPDEVHTHDHGFLHRLRTAFHEAPETREELIHTLHEAQTNHLITPDVLRMIEGALEVSNLCASDLMVQRAQIEAVNLSEKREAWLPKLIARGHSRFPVVDGDLDAVKGILHAKDLLRLLVDPDYDIASHLRPARFVPETQPLSILLRDFRASRNHLALVIDEFGSISGLITIEDVIEQIVGEIDDEFDRVNPEGENIVAVDEEHWRIRAGTEIRQFNDYFKSALEDDYCETIGGLITDRFEHVPHKGEMIEIEGFRFRVLKGDERQATLFLAEKVVAATGTEVRGEQGRDA